MTNRFWTYGFAGFVVAAIAGAAALPSGRQIHHIGDRCFLAFTDQSKALALGLTAHQAEELEEGGVDLDSLCSRSPLEVASLASNVEPTPEYSEDLAKFLALQKQSDDGTIDVNGASNARAQREAMALAAKQSLKNGTGPKSAESSGAPSAWRSLGPDNALAPQGYFISGYAGRVQTMVFSPSDPKRMLLGSNVGLWQSADAGANWTSVAGFPANLPISSIVFSPADANTIFVGVGDPSIGSTAHLALSGNFGAGIYRSTDGGVTWATLPATDPSKNRQWSNVTSIAIHPTKPATMVVATMLGMYLSLDSGLTWKLTQGQNNAQANCYVGATSVAFDPSNSNNLLIGGVNAIGRSVDSGQTWTMQDVPARTGCTGQRTEFAFAKSVPGLVYAYSGVNNGSVFKSTDGGATWALISNPASSADFQHTSIWVDPNDANFVVVIGLDLYRSLDGGVTFTAISDWRIGAGRTGTSPHADHHAIVIAPGYNSTTNRVIYDANDGGVWMANDIRTVTSAISETGWKMMNNGLVAGQLFSVAATTSGILAGGTQDAGLIITNGANLTSWATTYSGDNFETFFDPNDDKTVYSTYVGLAVQRSIDPLNKANTGLSYICQGITEAGSQCKNGSTGSYSANFAAPILMDPTNSKRIYGGGASLWVTQDSTPVQPVWTAIKPPSAASNNFISAIAVAPSDPNTVWVGHNNGEVYYTGNALATQPNWTRVVTGASRMVLRIMVSRTDPKTVYVTSGGYNAGNVLITRDSGATWSDVSDNLPRAPVYSILQDPSSISTIYAGTDVGVFVSTSGGSNWSIVDGAGNPGAAVVRTMVFVPGTRNLIVGTYGRGVFSYDASGAAAISPQAGWWWNPSEAGRGYAIEIGNGRIFMAAYMYRADGTAVWYVGNGPFANGTATIAMNEYAGSQTLSSSPPNTSGSSQVQANAVVTFTTSGQGSIVWAGGVFGSSPITTNIVRYPFNGTSVVAPSLGGALETGWWWNPNESGTGYFIEQQGTQIFMVDYMYAADKRDVWHYALGTPTLNSSTLTNSGGAQINMTAALTQAGNGQTLTTAAKAPTASTVGQITLRCETTVNCTVTLPNGRAVPIVRFTSF